MASELTTSLVLLLGATFIDDQDISDPQDNITWTFSDSLANGTGANQADVVWKDTGSAAGAVVDIDLHTSLDTVFTGIVATFVTIKGIIIHNKSTTPGENLIIGADAAPLANWVANAATDTVIIGPDGIFLLWSPIDGYAVTDAGADILQIDPGADTIAYDIMIIGTSA